MLCTPTQAPVGRGLAPAGSRFPATKRRADNIRPYDMRAPIGRGILDAPGPAPDGGPSGTPAPTGGDETFRRGGLYGRPRATAGRPYGGRLRFRL